MPDSWLVTGNLGWGAASPGATTLELASYCIADEGIDFDFGSLFQNTYAQNPAADGARLAYQQSGLRRFKFPLRLASSSSVPGGLSGLTEYLRRIVKTPAHPSAGYIDLLPENGSYAIRFDILDGRLDLRQYSVYRQRVMRHDYDLTLDVSPFGYLPTQILLASAPAGSGAVSSISWNPGSIIGDVPGLARIAIQPIYGPSWQSNFFPDGLYWTMANAGATVLFTPSMVAAATLGGFQVGNPNAIWAASHVTDAMAPAGMMLKIGVSPTVMASTTLQQGMGQLMRVGINDAPNFRGQFRVLGYFRSEPSHALQWQLAADVTTETADHVLPMASANPIASLISQSHGSYGNQCPSGYQLLDLGQVEIPPGGASGGLSQSVVRVWFGTATSNMGIATPFIECGGLLLWPVSGDSGIMPGGLQVPSSGAAFSSVTQSRLVLDSVTRRMTTNVNDVAGGWENASAPTSDARRYHVGPFPVVGTAQTLVTQVFARAGASRLDPVLGNDPPKVVLASFINGMSVSYRPRFTFLRGL